MIFEDGDLDADGGAQGRAQNFRWKNIDNVGDDGDNDAKGGDDDDDDDLPLVQTMEETEAQKKWRKQQFEREQWKKERSKTNEVPFSFLRLFALNSNEIRYYSVILTGPIFAFTIRVRIILR